MNRIKLWLPIMIVLILSFALPTAVLAADGVDTAEELKAALASGGAIELTGSFELGEKLTIAKDTTINGKGYTITRKDGYEGTLFNVTTKGTATFKNLTIDGGNNWTLDSKYDDWLENPDVFNRTIAVLYSEDPTADTISVNNYPVTSEKGKSDYGATASMIINDKGVLTFENCTIKNFFSVSTTLSMNTGRSGHEGKWNLIKMSGFPMMQNKKGGTVNLIDTTVKHCAAGASGAAVQMGGSSVLNIKGDSVLTDNYGGGNGGVIQSYGGSKTTLESGKITNNYAVDSNGTVIALHGTGATFTMKGGEISGNSGLYGLSNGRNASIYCHSQSTFIMTGGTIKENVGRGRGGVDFLSSAVKAEISGGSIMDNVSIAGNNGDLNVGTDDNTKFKITGGTFTQDVSTWVADGYGLVQRADGTWTVASEDKIFTITYALNEGEMPEGFYPVNFIAGDAYELPIPMKAGYTFKGWTGGKVTVPTQMVKVTRAPGEDVTYTANWQLIQIPATGDGSQLLLWSAMLMLGAAGLMVIRRRLGQTR